jgi:hypothetical protein
MPKGRKYANDRAPTIEEIRKMLEHLGRRIKPIIYTMASSRIRLGAWHYLRWRNISPIIKDSKIIAAKIVIIDAIAEEINAIAAVIIAISMPPKLAILPP